MLKDRPASPNDLKMKERERANLERLADYSSAQSLPEIWPLAAQRFENIIALHDPHAKPEVVLTYPQLYRKIQQFAAGLQALGVQPDAEPPSGAGVSSGAGVPARIALIADNSPRWMIADQGIMMAGAANVVRSAQAEKEELLYILENSGSTALVVEDRKTLKKLRDRLDDLPIQFAVLLSDEEPETSSNLKILNFSQLMAVGADQQLKPTNQNRDTLATLLYTSGTTGKPKGVMLSHGNLLHQVTTLGSVIQPQPGDIVLSILPTWHAYERAAEYFIISQGVTQIYTNLRHVKSDLKQFKPHYMVGVPRLWESIYEGVQKQFREQPANKQRLINTLLGISQKYIEARRIVRGLKLQPFPPSPAEKLLAAAQTIALTPIQAIADRLVYQQVRQATGGRLKYVLSGGGSLATHLDNFFEIVGVEVLVGYGLTETSPVTHARRPWHNLRGSAGQPIPLTECKIVDPETRQTLPVGQRGLVLVRGPQVMGGYYHNPTATAKAIDPEGWFDTGDLGWITAGNDLVLTGRAKDTIVLTNGENIEPQPIEDACLRSPYIDQIMLVGQDKRSLGALIVPNTEALQKWASSQNLRLHLPEETVSLEASSNQEIDLDSKIVQDLFRQELNREVQNRPGYRPDDRIGPFRLILEPFSIENGMMTQTLKIRRPVVMERYSDSIDAMY
ncbi:AMP-binding protein [Planktothrix sp. FACHB-1355]|uniref:AMP-binding protein n=1 Tax=Aerosakkonema funiforme FACHB-1375 TaxID=2949571 RepID=A0A926VBX7_9CYAN|nr:MULTISPECIES: long-chain fatty acid--CoA ligase [Oscillatoriales]MBD2180956.1 AMP-binding protein [Aerosakkonema funiforme FACHB-1375]MBD3557803.1 AMP-binding protein [Planktothrix sp. FACHB-1355]